MKTLKFKVLNVNLFKDLMQTIEKEMPQVRFANTELMPTYGTFIKPSMGVVIENNLITIEDHALLYDEFPKWYIGQSLLDTNPVAEVDMKLIIFCSDIYDQIPVLRKLQKLDPECRWYNKKKLIDFIPGIDQMSFGKCIFVLCESKLKAVKDFNSNAPVFTKCDARDFLKPDWKYIPPAPEPELKLVDLNEHGAVFEQTKYMKYDEMYFYLKGYRAATISHRKGVTTFLDDLDKPADKSDWIDKVNIPQTLNKEEDNTSRFLVVCKEGVCFEVSNKMGRELIKVKREAESPEMTIVDTNYFTTPSDIIHVIENPS